MDANIQAESFIQSILSMPDADATSMQVFDAMSLTVQLQKQLKQMTKLFVTSCKLTFSFKATGDNTPVYYAGMQIGTITAVTVNSQSHAKLTLSDDFVHNIFDCKVYRAGASIDKTFDARSIIYAYDWVNPYEITITII